MSEAWEALSVDGQAVNAFTASPDGDGPFPAVVVIQHAGGVDQFIQEMSGKLAAEGYFAIAPDLFHRQDPDAGATNMEKVGQLKDPEVIADVNAAIDFLKASPRANDNIGIIGFCMGGRVVYMMAGVNEALTAAVSFYGAATKNVWGPEPGPTPLERLAGAVCPVLGFFGEDDQNPSPQDMKDLDEQLSNNGRPHEFHSYAGAGHAYMNYMNPQAYREDAATASWPITLSFFEAHLSKVAAAR